MHLKATCCVAYDAYLAMDFQASYIAPYQACLHLQAGHISLYNVYMLFYIAPYDAYLHLQAAVWPFMRSTCTYKHIWLFTLPSCLQAANVFMMAPTSIKG